MVDEDAPPVWLLPTTAIFLIIRFEEEERAVHSGREEDGV